MRKEEREREKEERVRKERNVKESGLVLDFGVFTNADRWVSQLPRNVSKCITFNTCSANPISE